MRKIRINDQALLDLLHGLGAPKHQAPTEIAVDLDVWRQINRARIFGDTDEVALKRALRQASMA